MSVRCYASIFKYCLVHGEFHYMNIRLDEYFDVYVFVEYRRTNTRQTTKNQPSGDYTLGKLED